MLQVDSEPNLSNTLKQLIDSRGLRVNELAKNIGTPYTTIINLLNGSTDNPSAKTLIAISSYFNVSIDHLLGLKEAAVEAPKLDPDAGYSKVPIIGWDLVKQWIVQHHKALGTNCNEWVCSEKALPSNAFALRIENSIYKPAFLKNSVIIVEPHENYGEDEYVVVSINKKKPTLRYLSADSGELYLNSISASIPSEPYSSPNVIFGRVVEYRYDC